MTTFRSLLALGGILVLGACAQGPTEFASYDAGVEPAPTAAAAEVRTPDERDRVASSLAAAGARASAAGRSIPATDALALTAVRDQQTEAAASIVLPVVPPAQ